MFNDDKTITASKDLWLWRTVSGRQPDWTIDGPSLPGLVLVPRAAPFQIQPSRPTSLWCEFSHRSQLI